MEKLFDEKAIVTRSLRSLATTAGATVASGEMVKAFQESFVLAGKAELFSIGRYQGLKNKLEPYISTNGARGKSCTYTFTMNAEEIIADLYGKEEKKEISEKIPSKTLRNAFSVLQWMFKRSSAHGVTIFAYTDIKEHTGVNVNANWFKSIQERLENYNIFPGVKLSSSYVDGRSNGGRTYTNEVIVDAKQLKLALDEMNNLSKKLYKEPLKGSDTVAEVVATVVEETQATTSEPRIIETVLVTGRESLIREILGNENVSAFGITEDAEAILKVRVPVEKAEALYNAESDFKLVKIETDTQSYDAIKDAAKMAKRVDLEQQLAAAEAQLVLLKSKLAELD